MISFANTEFFYYYIILYITYTKIKIKKISTIKFGIFLIQTQRSNRFTNKKVTGFLKKNITTFFGKTKMYARTRYVCQLFFYFHFCKCYVNTKRIPLEHLYQNQPTLISAIRGGGRPPSCLKRQNVKNIQHAKLIFFTHSLNQAISGGQKSMGHCPFSIISFFCGVNSC